jgi:hypothetical protein
LLQLLLFTDGDIRRNPAVAPDPDDRYGAIFTSKCKHAYEEPYVTPRELFPKENEAIDEIIKMLTADHSKQIILATASGWDTTHSLRAFHGPHVGSHANMLFKRALFKTGNPIVLFLSRHKVDSRFREAKFKCRTDTDKPKMGMRYCYPVFGPKLPLAEALVKTPLALCIGYDRGKKQKGPDIRLIGEELKNILRPQLNQAGFDFAYAAKEFIQEDGTQAGAIMVANKKFTSLFPRQN